MWPRWLTCLQVMSSNPGARGFFNCVINLSLSPLAREKIAVSSKGEVGKTEGKKDRNLKLVVSFELLSP